MTYIEALSIIERYEFRSVLSDDEEFLLLEALRFMIDTTGKSEWMVRLGGYYYEKKDFDLALKYYEMADEAGDPWAPEGLGYIWYYGRTGERDYEKAFGYYHRAMENGYLRSMVKVADMYRNGYGVKQDDEMYVELIEAAYVKVKGARFLNDPLPEVFTRLAKIRQEQGRIDEAVGLLLEARAFLAERIAENPFFGELNIMKWLEEDLRKLVGLDRSDFDLYDLYRLMEEPVKVRFMYDGEEYEVESVADDGGVSIRFGEEWFRGIDDFFAKAILDGERIPCRYDELYAFKVV